MPSETYKKLTILFFLLAAIKGLLLVFLIPLGQGPDEPGHVAHIILYVRQEKFRLVSPYDSKNGQKSLDPVDKKQFWDFVVQADSRVIQDILDLINRYRFWNFVDVSPPAPSSPTEIRRRNLTSYIAVHRYITPLYFYLVSLPVRWLGIEELTIQWFLLRLFSWAFGLGVIGFTYATAKMVWQKEEGHLPTLAAASFLAFLPQFSFLSSVVSPDNLLIFLSSAVIYIACRGIIFTRGRVLTGILLVGLGLLSAAVKEHGLPILLFVLFTLFFTVVYRPQGISLVRKILIMLVVIIVICVGIIYAFRDDLALRRVWEVILARFVNPNETFLLPSDYARCFLIWLVSFWFSYGWMVYKMSLGWYIIFGLMSLTGVIGIIRLILPSVDRDMINMKCIILLIAFSLFSMGATLFFFGPRHPGMQARHFFSAFPAIAILMSMGIWSIAPSPYRENSLKIFIMVMAFVNVITLLNYLIPIFYLGK